MPQTVQPPREDLIRREGLRLQKRYARMAWRALEHPIRDLDVLRRSAWFLEYLAVGLAGYEAAKELGIESWAQAQSRISDWSPLVVALSGVDFERLARETLRFCADQREPELPETGSVAEFHRLLEAVCRTLKNCPIDELDEISERLHEPELGHRCRSAHTQLCAILRRNKTPQDHVLVVLGQAYAQGRLSEQEVADILKVPAYDAVALLEEHGYIRQPDVIQLDGKTRQDILARIRSDRLRRKGIQPVSTSAIRREVIASQRIEGVDARPWLKVE